MKFKLYFKLKRKDSENFAICSYNLYFFNYLYQVHLNFILTGVIDFDFEFSKKAPSRSDKYQLKIESISKGSLIVEIVLQSTIAFWAVIQTLMFFSDRKNRKKLMELFVQDLTNHEPDDNVKERIADQDNANQIQRLAREKFKLHQYAKMKFDSTNSTLELDEDVSGGDSPDDNITHNYDMIFEKTRTDDFS